VIIRPLVLVRAESWEATERLVRSLRARVASIDFEALDEQCRVHGPRASHRPAVILLGEVESAAQSMMRALLRRWSDAALLWWGRERPAGAFGRAGVELAVNDGQDLAIARYLLEDLLGAAHGTLEGLSVPAILQMLSTDRRTCHLELRSGALLGSLFLRDGEVVHGSHGALSGRDATLEILTWRSVDARITPLDAQIERSLREPLATLLLEAQRATDEANQRAREEATPGPDESSHEVGRPSGRYAIAPSRVELSPARAVELSRSLAAHPGVREVDVVDVLRQRSLARHVTDEGAVRSEAVTQAARAALLLFRQALGERPDRFVLSAGALVCVARVLPEHPQVVLCVLCDSDATTVLAVEQRITASLHNRVGGDGRGQARLSARA
jgi:hypothetical protein